MSDPLLVERRGPAAWLTLNRPDKVNALNAELLAGVEAALHEVAADDEAKVVVLTGAGERACSAGFDLEAAAGDSLGHAAEQWHEHLEYDVAVTMRLWSFPKPTIAAVRGHCLAGGCELAMACDMVVSGESGRFGEPEIRFGSGPVTYRWEVRPRPAPARARPKDRPWAERRPVRADASAAARPARRRPASAPSRTRTSSRTPLRAARRSPRAGRR